MKKYLTYILFICTLADDALATVPSGRNTEVVLNYFRQDPPDRLDIWRDESGGYDPVDPQKWGRNTLTCLSRTDSTNGACMTAPVWFAAPGASSPKTISLLFTHELTKKTVDMQVSSNKQMFLKSKVYTFASHVTGGNSDVSLWVKEPVFNFFIPKSELIKLNVAGSWSATLKQNLREWGSAPCGGNFNDANVGCPGYLTLASWQANIRIDVLDDQNKQIYLPAFPSSAPVINLNLRTSPGGQPGKLGSNEIEGKTSLDMCLYDGNNSKSSRVTLKLSDEGQTVPGRESGAFSIWRRGGNQAESRDRLDYRVSVINPLTSTSVNVANGVDIVWQGTNDSRFLRTVVLPGTSEQVLCVPAPLILTTPRFVASSKNIGDYTGTLHIFYTPSTY